MWVTTLELAERWGVPPWEVEEGAMEWASKAAAWQTAKRKAQDALAKKRGKNTNGRNR